MPVFNDQLNRVVSLTSTPQRIISLVPSLTELLFDLGLDEEIVGVTNFCVYPMGRIAIKPKIGGTKNLNLSAIHLLQPDLIIANKEENDRLQIEKLIALYPVWISDITDLPGCLDMIGKLGEVLCRTAESSLVRRKISQEFSSVIPFAKPIGVAYLIWRKPYMAAGNNTFIDSMLKICGFVNVIEKSRYPEITVTDITIANPDVLLLSSEPYPFKQKHVTELHKLLPDTKIILVDGELFSWYGSRLIQAPVYFNTLIKQL